MAEQTPVVQAKKPEVAPPPVELVTRTVTEEVPRAQDFAAYQARVQFLQAQQLNMLQALRHLRYSIFTAAMLEEIGPEVAEQLYQDGLAIASSVERLTRRTPV
jgi:hypothetical protein